VRQGYAYGGVLLLVPIAGLSCGTGICFFLFFYAIFAFRFVFFSFLGLEVAGGGVLSRVGSIGYSMESCSSWFEPLPDLHMNFIHKHKL
jgi:hypothetical protein